MALLPKITMRGVPGHGVVQDKSAQIRRNYNTLAQGIGDIGKVVANIEEDRLDEQAQQAAHDYELASLNADAEQFTKQYYEAGDPALAGLNIRTTEQYVGPDGEMLERNREQIPADEVWPELLGKTRENLLSAHAQSIESDRRRADFVRTAKEEQAQNNLRLLSRSAELQYARGVEQRKNMAVAYREMGRWDKVYDMIDTVKDPEEKARLREWAEPLEVFDHNTSIIAGGMATLNKEPLQKEYDKYLGYMENPDTYSGPLNQQELEKEAHRLKSHMGQIDTANNANRKMFVGDIKYDARLAINALNKGQYVTTEDLVKVGERLNFAISQDPDNEELYKLNRDAQLAIVANEQFRQVIGTVEDGKTVADNIAQWKQYRDGFNTSKDLEGAKVLNQVGSMIKTFETAVNSNPMDAIKRYELDAARPIGDVDFSNLETLSDQLSEREFNYNYYQGIYEYDADVLGKNERAQLNTMLADETVTLDSHLLLSREVYRGMRQNYEKMWGPSISDKDAGKRAALGLLMTDWETIGAPGQGFNVAQTVQRGFDRWARDPTIVDDYRSARESIRTELSMSYSEFPGMMDNYLDMAMAYAISTTKKKYVKKKDIEEALDVVTGGLVEQGGRRMMTPAAGVNSVTWTEYLQEYSPDNITQPIQGWTATEVMDGIADDNLILVPTGRSRNTFYVVDPRQPSKSGIRNADGSSFVFTYDPSAEKRFRNIR